METFKYSVFFPNENEPTLQTNKYSEVIDYLAADDEIKEMAMKDFNNHRETDWNDQDCQDWIEEHAVEMSKYVGYKIVLGFKKDQILDTQ